MGVVWVVGEWMVGHGLVGEGEEDAWQGIVSNVVWLWLGE